MLDDDAVLGNSGELDVGVCDAFDGTGCAGDGLDADACEMLDIVDCGLEMALTVLGVDNLRVFDVDSIHSVVASAAYGAD